MEGEREEKTTLFDKLAVPVFLALMFVAPDYIGDVSLEGLDTYVLDAPAGSLRAEVEAGLRHFRHCYYRKPSRTVTDAATDYVFHGTTSDVGFFVAVTVHCPFDAQGGWRTVARGPNGR